MSKTRIRRSMNLAAFGFVSAAVGIVAWTWYATPQSVMTFDAPTNGTQGDGKVTQSRGANSDSLMKRQALIASDLWSTALRSGFNSQPMQTTASNVTSNPTPPPMPSPPYVATTDLGLRLVGTVLEQGESMAIAIDRQGKLDFRKEGESFELNPEGVRVESVSVDSIRVSYQGLDSTWKLSESLVIRPENTMPVEPAQNMTMPPAMPSVEVPVTPMSIDEELESLNGN